MAAMSDAKGISDTDKPQAQREPIHDENYFDDDGDCLFLAEGVLFKLHKWSLCRDPDSMFRNMFSIPQGPGQAKVLDPIPLSEDTAEEFRALCWVVYALPNETHLQTSRDADVRRLLHVVKMCHKYSLPMFESWALEMLHIQCQRPLDHLSNCSEDVLDGILALASLCGHTQLLGLVETAWVSRVQTGELQCSNALIAGERYGRRRFQGEIYYHLNNQIHSELRTTLTPARGFSHLKLTDIQLLKLLSGHALLSNFWTHVRRDPPPLFEAGGCHATEHSICSVICQNHIGRWESQFRLDVLKGLKHFKDNLSGPSVNCVRAHLDTHIAGIADYFLGPEIIVIPNS
ncbi:hypothetical protein C8R44DRAFT_772632 [Mycena epipterygia]|nr:hypothetical protein C8R44DRAFT_772632 [Mycena epipterygia]